MATKRTTTRAGDARSTKAGKKTGATTTTAKQAASPRTVIAWQDDPASGLPTVPRQVPNLASGPLKFKFKGPAVPPGAYPTGTPQFRYWTAAEALRRGADFWAPVLGVKQWQPGPVLQVGLDEGLDFNAYYDRTQLAFFHGSAGGKVYYSGESPDVVCHEMGHACLDAHRPELWDAPFIEAGAFHESFGDTSAIISALQLPDVRKAALDGVAKNKPSPLSRLAEQLGLAIRQVDPSAVEKDCLRNAWNAFQYVDPETLPDSAPATQLSAEVHSFSRIFTGAFYEVLGGMLKIRSAKPTPADLSAVATDYSRLLLDATAAAPVQPNYFAQVASHMIDADTSRFGGKYRSALTKTFVKRKIIPPQAVAPLLAFKGKVPKNAVAMIAPTNGRAKQQTQQVRLSAAEFGLADRPLIVPAPVDQKPFVAVSLALLHKNDQATSDIERATHRFVQSLFANDRVDSSAPAKKQSHAMAGSQKNPRHTHVLVEVAEGLKLVRRQFDCGCRCAQRSVPPRRS
jgi:hypothetical protein